MKNTRLKTVCLFILCFGWLVAEHSAFAGMDDYSAIPPFVLRGTAANVLFDLSIESPMQGAAYNDQPDDRNGDGDYADALECSGRTGSGYGRCYFKDQEYIGIFDPNKCYTYSSNRFEPSSAATDHECSGKWSGNFLNWATMTAIDEFRWTLTGGNRVVDTTTETVLQRANMTLRANDALFPYKIITSAGTDANVAPSTVTPYSETAIYIYNHGYQFDVGTGPGWHDKAQNLEAKVKACDPTKGLEDNCVDYGSYYKPEGLIQDKADKLRFGLMGYLLTQWGDPTMSSRDGGILRADMKYVGPTLPDGTANTKKEYGTDGIFIYDPESASTTNSGIINYINQFGANGYKSKDPASELFYECLNYFKGRAPTAEYYTGYTTTQMDGFPVKTTWSDPIQYRCQKNYIVGINDANPWFDKQLPGTYFTSSTFAGHTLDSSSADFGEPSTPDSDYSVTTWTNTVGDLQGLTGKSRCVGCTESDCDMNTTNKTITGLGEVMGTCPDPVKENSYYIAGLAYYANSQDIRSDFTGKQSVTTFMIDTQEYKNTPLVGEMNMLWLAGKYGGFEEKDFTDSNGDGNVYEPNQTSEWDADSDGEPDNYVLATKPEKLVDGLNKAFSDIIKRASSGTAASVISNSRSGEGAAYQSIFYPFYSDSCSATSNEVKWIGEVHALFIDDFGNMREDSSPQNGTLDLTSDKIIIFDGNDVYKFTDSNGSGQLDAGIEFTDSNGNGILDKSELSGSVYTSKEVDYLWSSSTWLNDTTLDATTQRTYSSTEKKRYIFTLIDDGDMVAESGEQIEFTTDTANMANIYPYLHLFTPFAFSSASPPPGITSADYTTYLNHQKERQIKYIRGEDQDAYAFSSSMIPAMRSRNVDFECDGTEETWRLGDVIHSTPTVVGAPSEGYDLIYKDETYQAFLKKYQNRRNVVYVGSNDGMLHAFNGGFFDSASHSFKTQPLTANPFPPFDLVGDTTYANYDLGAELWAYVPFNLLPHLYWLTDPNYSHVYYVDMKPKIFDARIYDPSLPGSDVHPYGWATIMVCGMGLGGGAINTDKDKDGTHEPSDPTLPDQEMRSAYIIMDITNPEEPPNVLAEVTFSDLGYTTSYPSVIVMDPKSTGGANNWYLVLGSGPINSGAPNSTALQNTTSDQRANIYIVNLNTLTETIPTLTDQNGSLLPAAGAFQTLPDSNSYISEFVSVDMDLDYKTDAVYFGTISGSSAGWGGRLRRIVIDNDLNPSNWQGNSLLMNVGKPITAPPTLSRDKDMRIWVHFGTGRFMNRTDVTNITQQSYYGVKEPWDDADGNGLVDSGEELTWDEVSTANLLNVSLATVYENGNTVTGVSGDIDGDGTVTFEETESTIKLYDGWYLDFVETGERNLGGTVLLGDILTFTTYIPDSDPCEYEGTSQLYVLYYKTGTAYTKSIVGLGTGSVTNTSGETEYEVSKKTDLGGGMTITPNVHTGSESGAKVFIQTSTGAIETIEQSNLGIIKSGKVYWIEE